MKTNQSAKYAKCAGGVKLFTTWLKLAALALAFLPLFSAQATDYYWSTTNAALSGNITTAPVGWVGGVAPSSSADNAFIAGTNTTSVYFITNDTTVSIGNLIYDLVAGTTNAAGSGAITTVINPGTTLSVLGSQGFYITRDVPIKFGSTHTFIGNTLTVNNPSASFILNSGQGVGQNTAATINFSALTNLNVTVSVFGVANSLLTGINGGGNAAGDEVVKATLARTNVITASHTEDYTTGYFTNAVDLFRQDNIGLSTGSDAANSFFALGISNRIFADSVGIGRGTAIKGSSAISMATLIPATTIGGSAAGYSMQFNKKDYSSSAYFRNNDGSSRMSLLDVTVNGGGTNTLTTGNRVGSFITFVGGTVDMLVDQIWLAKNYTNTFSTKLTDAGFGFDKGTVNANTVLVGDMQYTNASFCNGWLYVGSNAVMNVNKNLVLGYTPTNDTSGVFVAYSSQAFGQVEVEGNGHLYANQINVGLFSTNNQVIVNPGASLIVTNTIATATNSLCNMKLDSGAQLTLFVNPAITNVFTTNLISGASQALINIASYSGAVSYPATNVLIHYQTNASHNVHIGSLAPGYNNMQVVDDGAGNIVLIVSTNAPKNLVWQGAQNNLWDHASTNWIDLALNAPTNITKFTDNDTVTFNDAPGVPVNITIADASVSPAAVTVTNWANNKFVFNNTGGANLIASAGLTKKGTNSLEIDCPSSLAVSVNEGSLIGNGSVSTITVASGASMNFAGAVTASLTSAGSATVASGGIISGAVNVSAGGVVTNAGTMNGTLNSLPSGSLLYNASLMTAAGSPTINTNATLINAGTIYAGTITVALGGTLIDKVVGTTGLSPGSLNVVQLIVNGAFYPGAGTLTTTKLTDYSTPSTLLGPPNGRINLNQGSTTYLEVNMDSGGQTNSSLLAQNQGFGGSVNFKSFNGGTLVITRSGATQYAAGQTFKFFGYYYNDGNMNNAGLNTQNTYPIISPATPGAGLVWDMSQLYITGTIGVLSATDPRLFYSLTNNVVSVTSSNIVNDLTWSPDKVGGWILQLNATLTNGLSATNWTAISGGTYLTNIPNVYEILVTNNLIANPNAQGSATFFQFVYPYHP